MKTTEQRFWDNIGPHSDPNACWLWVGRTVKNGNILRYGALGVSEVKDKYVRAHRYAYELLVGPIPEGITIDHVKSRGCTSTLCVNPAHLEPVTMRVNLLRGNGYFAVNARKTHCPQGHKYDTTYIDKSEISHRRCSVCTKNRRLNA